MCNVAPSGGSPFPHRANHGLRRPSTIASFRLIQAASLLVGVSGLAKRQRARAQERRGKEREGEREGLQQQQQQHDDGQDDAVSGR